MSKYKYRLKISQTSEIFLSQEFIKFTGGNIKNILVESDEFDTIEDVERVLGLLLTVINKFISPVSTKKYIVSIKHRSDLSSEEWPFEVISRMYLADIDKLKQSLLEFSIFAEIYHSYSSQKQSSYLN